MQLQLSMIVQLRVHISVAVLFNDTVVATNAAVSVISVAALVSDAALEVVNVCCS